ncbi:MAG: TauD/TfdA family dioxygenase [Acidimicrobiia bacterium]|nr:TauD/TfdA family dioxygenase [Acidimicrobiia bacterium]
MSTDALTSLSVTAAEPNLGARVEGIDLTAGTDPERVAALRALLLEHHVLVLPAQDLNALELEAFARQWGELLTHPATQHRDTPYIQWIPGSGTRGNRFGHWHSDMTWHPTPPCITMLHSQRLPAAGGDTCFANQQLAYETLPDHLLDVLDGASAYHSGKTFGPDTPDSVHPAVRTHDESGAKALYVNAAFTTHLIGIDPEVSRQTLADALLHATRVELTYRHKWDLHDLVIWDNRSVMHCPAFDYEGERYMHRAVVQGGVPA